MLSNILVNVPAWVWVLLAVLLGLGISQSVTRKVGLRRAAVLPVAMTGLSCFSSVSAFGAAIAALVAWLVATVAAAWWIGRRRPPGNTTYDPATALFTVPGSWLPMMLILGIFALKFAVATSLAMHPEFAADFVFSVLVASLYGASSGVFVGRAGRLLRLATASALTKRR